jgi:hypothetical protein
MKRYALQVLMSAGALGLILSSNHGSAQTAASKESDRATIRPFRVSIPEADLADLKRRIAATRWPDKETVGSKMLSIPMML